MSKLISVRVIVFLGLSFGYLLLLDCSSSDSSDDSDQCIVIDDISYCKVGDSSSEPDLNQKEEEQVIKKEEIVLEEKAEEKEKPFICSQCHGEAERSAPPLDTLGNTATTFLGVGAHVKHEGTSDWHAEIPCEACHIVPENDGETGHNDTDLPAEVVFGKRAKKYASKPKYISDGTCLKILATLQMPL